MRFLAIFIGVVALISLVSCEEKTRAQRAAEEGILLLGNGSEPKALDPALTQSVGDSNLMISMFEGLVSYDPVSDDEVGKGVAKDWRHSDDYRVWTFDLRKDAKWSNGDDVTAHDFIYAHHRTLHPVLGSPYSSMLYFLKHAKEYNQSNYAFFLCGQDEEFPVNWETLKKADLTGTETIDSRPGLSEPECGLSARELGDLMKNPETFAWPESVDEDKREGIVEKVVAFRDRPEFNQTGLNNLKPKQLKELIEKPVLFEWPKEIPAEAGAEVVKRIAEFKKNDTDDEQNDLWDIANVGCKAIDDFTLEYSLELPTPYLLSVLRHQTWLPVHRKTIEDNSKYKDNTPLQKMTEAYSNWQRPGNHVGNGPFKLKSWRVNHSIVVEPNPHYWDAETVKLKEIHFLPIDNWFTEERMYRDGQLHVTYILPSNVRGWYQDNKPELLRREPYAGIYFYRLNIGKNGVEAMRDKRVRKALTYAIDRQELADYVTLGGERPAHGFSFPMGEYVPPKVVKFDPDQARQLLADAGYPGGEGFPKLDLMINTSEQHRTIAEAIQAMWKKELGIEVDIDNQEWKVFQQTTFEEKYQIARAGWIGDFMDVTTFLDMMRTGDSNNNTGWGNPRYDQLLKEAAVESSTEDRRKKLFEAEEILLDELPVIPIYWYSRVYLIDPSVKNWNPLVLDKRDYKHVWLEPQE